MTPPVVQLAAPTSANPGSAVPSSSLFALAAAIALIIAACWIWRRARPDDPGEAAFLAISRALRLSRAERLLIRELSAAHGKASPTALLLSEHALKEAVHAAEGIGDSARVEHLVKKLDDSTRRLAA